MKTIKEAAKESYFKEINPETSGYEGFFHYTDELLYSAGFKEGVEFTQRWISIKDEFPPRNTKVIIKDEWGNYGFFSTLDKLHNSYLYLVKYYTHWRLINLL